MRVFYINLVVLLIVSACAGADEKKTPKTATTEKKPEEPKLGELQALEKVEDLDDQEAEEVNRKKKSTTTTFCVEIRPSGEDQRPFQVCEPAVDSSKANYGAPGYYQSPQSYGGGGQEQQKPHSAPYQSQTGQTKPAAAAFTNSVKTFAGSTQAAAASKPYSPTMPYGGYRSMDEDDRDFQLKRMSPDSDSDEDNDSLESGRARSSYDGYSSSYGVPPPHTPLNKKHLPHSGPHGQNGLVITCQPSLAGYAHPPSTYHGPTMPVPSYSYRSSSGKYARPYQPYRPYGGYQHPGGTNPFTNPA
ncbi:uncharacterized protein [Leptinotarsa decemlineata]|uniref:uncharacterized protein n=1 Tax=Leptinotarsa decemlineata TaxID=7539 RepID=UPI003D30C6FF